MSKIFDVVIVGYGPVSQLLALALGRQGRTVAIIERWKERYPLPRAVAIDHELYRVLHANGLGTLLPKLSHGGDLYHWYNANWKELLVLDWSEDAVSGGTFTSFVHQPTLEWAIDGAVTTFDNITLLLGKEAEAIRQDDDKAWVDITDVETGAADRIAGRYLVGCDGANSKVRQEIGSEQEDLGFQAHWLVIDVMLKEGVTIESLGIPLAAQYCNPAQPTTIVPGGVSHGRMFRRWEFMILPGVDPASMETEEKVWELLKPWAGPDDVELVRHKIYNFRSLIARDWRDGRVLLAGDAAHVMPPFLGQGMCSGFRDAWNLAWRLGLIFDGEADDSLLDGYQLERSPHVRHLIEMSVYLGKIICIPDEEGAARRDQAFFSGTNAPFPDFPHLTGGLLRHDAQGQQPGAGEVSPHSDITWHGETGRMDDLTGPGFLLITRDDIAIPRQLGGLPLHKLVLDDRAAEDHAVMHDDRIGKFLDEMGWSAMVVRPDYYVYGGATPGGEAELLSEFADDLASRGVRLREQARDREPHRSIA